MTERDTLAEQLRALGLGAGAVVMVHASLRKLGIKLHAGDTSQTAGAAMLIQAIRDAIGADGTMLMVLGAEESDESEPFDAATSEVDTEEMGALCEAFRTYPGVQVNDHAAARFAAIGPLAAHLLNPTPLHDYYGPNSVLDRFIKVPNACVLRLGADLDTVTLTHHAEYLASVPDKRRVRRRYYRADIGEQWIESLDDTDGITDWSGGDYFPQLLRDYLSQAEARDADRARVGPVGALHVGTGAQAELLPAAPFVRFAVAWMERHLS